MKIGAKLNDCARLEHGELKTVFTNSVSCHLLPARESIEKAAMSS